MTSDAGGREGRPAAVDREGRPAAVDRFNPPESFEEYRLLRPLGQGAMGQVFLAHDRLLDRLVAVKFIAAVEPSEAARQQFFTEARAIARLSHPNVVAIYRVGEIQRRPYLVSEYVEGQGLEEVPRPMPWPKVVALGIGLARGLWAVHRRGVLHRDLKPANARLSADGEVKLLDFGLAKLLGPTLPTQPRSAPALPRTRDALPRAPLADSLRAYAGLTSDVPPRAAAPLAASHETHDALPSQGPGPRPLAASHETHDAVSLGEVQPLGATRPAPRAPDSLGATAPAPQRPQGRGAAVNDRVTSDAPAEVVGSPLYMAPELWLGEPASERSDLYALGTLLYELCAGRAPFWDRTLLDLPNHVQEFDPRPLEEVAPSVDPRLCAIIHRCLRRDPAERPASASDLREALEALTEASAPRAIPAGNPYRGLFCFEEAERGLFFGRDAEVRALLDRLRADPFVLVAGDSGVGKSSLCRAGVLGAVADGRLWPRVQVARLLPGRRPLLALVSALAALPGCADLDEVTLLQRLGSEPALLALELRRRFSASHTPAAQKGQASFVPEARLRPSWVRGEGDRLVIFIDQMEELLTLAEPEEARLCAESLGAIVDAAPGVRLLGAARSDYLTRLSGLPGIGPALGRALHLVSPLSEEGLRQAVVQPALAKGARFENEELVETLVTAARAEGGLPLLQFSLAALWDARDEARRVIPAAALADLGGVAGALARHADEVYFGLPPPERLAARRLLSRLVTAEGTRARRPERELLGAGAKDARVNEDQRGSALRAAEEALQALVRGRLVLARAGEGGESVYELAHEALLSGWGTLRALLHSDAELRLVRQRLEQAAREWERLLQAPELLWGERQLQQVPPPARGKRDEDGELWALLGAQERAFLGASRAATRQRRRRRWLAGLGAPLLLVAALTGVRLSTRLQLARRVASELQQVDRSLWEARAQRALQQAAAQAAYKSFGGRDQRGGEARWEEALRAAEAARQHYGAAARTLEMALTLDASYPGLRRRFAEVLYEEVLAAEAARDRRAREEALGRLGLYDDGEVLRARLRAPALLALRTEPAAQVGLERLVEDPETRRRAPLPPLSLGTAPLQRQLEPGSYVLLLQAPGRAPVRYPVLLQRGERLALSLALLPAAQVPPGFVYIPAGRFLFGSGAAEELRRTFYGTAPLFEARTDAYLIARTETTYADWLVYLRDLPPAERKRRLQQTSGMQGAVALRERPDGRFELLLRTGEQEHRALERERIHYPHRERRADPDWLRLPVGGINFEDARAYTEWLAQTRRVPGARLCTEYEWERAARGADDRLFPHGDRVASDDGDLDITYKKDPLALGPDEVGAHPASRSPFGVDDLLGNIFEWVVPSISAKPAMVRGGSYNYGERTSTSVSRQEPQPAFRDATLGLRVCATPPR